MNWIILAGAIFPQRDFLIFYHILADVAKRKEKSQKDVSVLAANLTNFYCPS
jgi:hypothetical protein